MTLPLIGVVVVNYHREVLTLSCLEYLAAVDWPQDRLEVLVIDNGSSPGFEEAVSRGGLGRVIASGWNLGFGGACNVGFDALSHCDHVLLLNNDAFPEQNFLAPLVETIERTGAGAVTPKVLLQGSWLPVSISTPAVRPGRGEPRVLGLQLSGARVDGREVMAESQLSSGFWGWEHDAVTVGGRFVWTGPKATLQLPAPERNGPVEVELRLSNGLAPTTAEVDMAGEVTALGVNIQPQWKSIGKIAERASLINNTGTELRPDGSIVDRGYLEPDDGRFDDPEEVFGWSGAAVLLSRPYLDDVGCFDDRYFLYYEDSELSWRGRLRGWRYHYVPASVVRHEHSATVGESSSLAQHLLARNRLVTLARHAPRRLAATAAAQIATDIQRAAWRDVIRRLLTLQRPIPDHTMALARIMIGAGRLLPGTLRARRTSGLTESERAEALRPWWPAKPDPAIGRRRS